MGCEHSETKAFLKCAQCGKIALPEITKPLSYFELFGLTPSYSINFEILQSKFYELSRLLHPDRFQTKSPDDLLRSTHWSAFLNKAFNTLKDPEPRAFYIFDLAKFNTSVKGSLPPELAEDYFNLQETLEENEEKGKILLHDFRTLVLQTIEKTDLQIESAFRDWEKSSSPLDQKANSFFEAAARGLQQKAYLRSMSSDLEKKWPL
jgi:molecular chaperone HscB